jgi:hypothetical protein
MEGESSRLQVVAGRQSELDDKPNYASNESLPAFRHCGDSIGVSADWRCVSRSGEGPPAQVLRRLGPIEGDGADRTETGCTTRYRSVGLGEWE